MTLKKIIAALAVVAAIAFGGFIFSAQAVTYVYDNLNRLAEVHFEDNTWIQYTYDNVGNLTGQTYYNELFPITVTSGAGGSIDPSSASIIYGGSQTFTIAPDPNYNVADVLVDGADQGAITSYTFNNVTSAHSIAATFALNTYQIEVFNGIFVWNGSISPPGATVSYGGSQTFAIIPDTGYEVADVIVDGADLGAITSYTFNNVTADHVISASFAPNTNTNYAITASAGTGGSISPSGTVTVNSGASESFTITPNTGYAVSDVVVDGSSVGAVASYTFSSVTDNHNISASFAAAYNITASGGTGGSISPSGTVTVDSGANETFTITPDTDLAVSDVLVDGSSVGAVTAYTFYNVTADHTISATFAANTGVYIITADSISPTGLLEGSISPSGTVLVNQGSDQTFSFSTAPECQVSSVLVDGLPIPATLPTASGCTFTNVSANHTLVVSFTPTTSTAGSYSFTDLDYPDAADTYAYGINDSGQVTGYYVDSSSKGHGFVYSGVFTTLDNPGAAQTVPAGINNNGQVTGYYSDSSSNGHGFIYSGGAFTTLDNPDAAQTYPAGINNNGQVTGSYYDSSSNCHGFIYSGGVFTTLDYPGAIITNPYGINDSGQVTGYYFDIWSNGHGFVYSGGVFTTFDYPGVTWATLSGINDGGQVTGYYSDSSDNHHSVVYGPAISAEIGYPGAISTNANGINNSGQVTGSYTYGWSGHSFVASPAPTITASAGMGGSIWPSGAVTVNSGGRETFTITPNTGYEVADVSVDGTSQGPITSYTFSGVTANHTIAATFSAQNSTYTITASAGTGGSISPSGAFTVNSGASQTFTITPNTGYQTSSVQVDGVSLGALTTYTFSSVAANHTISAAFAPNTLTITTSAGANGSISPASATVNYNGSQTFTILPNAGYHVADVLVDGADQGAITSYTFSNVTAAHTISATFAINTFTITTSAGANGSISPASATVNYNENQTFSITPNTGYIISNVAVDGTSQGAITSYTFSNVTANHTISATFVATCTITAAAGTGGSISPSGAVTVDSGAGQTFTITPNTGYVISNVAVDGTSQGAITSYTFSNVTANHTISATFAATCTITAVAGSGGSISPSGAVTVDSGAGQTFTITPNTGYVISNVAVDGTSQGAITSYTFSNVTANHTISATFVATCTITATAGAGGSISPSGAVTVDSGAGQTFTITPNTGYVISNVAVDGTSQGAITSYTFSNVTANHTILATFVTTYTITATAGTGGSISPPGTVTVNSGAGQTFTITPNTGYVISNVAVDGTSQGAITSYTFSNVTAGHTISATFVTTYTITATAGSGGSISPSGAVTVDSGASQTFTIAPAAGYQTSSVQVDGVSLGALTTYTFSSVSANHTITATFVASYTITETAGTGGSISPSGTVTLDAGVSQTFTITPSSGYVIFNVAVDGTSQGAITSYTFSNVAANHTINATFAINTYSITTSVNGGSGGTISPTSPLVNFGSSQTFTIMPNTYFYVADVVVDGADQGAITSYTFNNVTANHTLSATFAGYPIINTRINAGYTSLQAAYNDALDGDTILTQNVLLTANFTANRNISVSIDGGYNGDFSANPDKTTIKGAAVINNGTVAMKNYLISN